MSPGPDPQQVDYTLLEETRKRINQIVALIARDSESDMSPGEYFSQFLQRVLDAVAAPAGAVWIRTPQGNLQLQYHIRMNEIGIDRSEEARQQHDELLRTGVMNARPQLVPPRSGMGKTPDGKTAAGNPTDHVIHLAPMLLDKQVAGLIEVWQDAERNPQAQEGFLRFITQMAGLASTYIRNNQLRSMVGQQALWTQLESFTRQIHASLNPMEVGYVIANEGRRLVDCDRLSVGLRRGRWARVEAVSGADVVERRSNLIRLMTVLFEQVMRWGEKLTYRGVKDDSLPPNVLDALDAFLAESNSKLLVVVPLRDDREGENSKKPPRSALMMECFDPAASPDQLLARLDVVGRHATSALYNAAEYRRVPLRWLWLPIAKVQEGLGGKTRAILLAVAVGLIALAAVMVFVDYPLKMNARGQMLPTHRRYVFSVKEANIESFKIIPGQEVKAQDDLAVMYDTELHKQIVMLQGQIDEAQKEINAYDSMINKVDRPDEKFNLSMQKEKSASQRDARLTELNAILSRTNSIAGRPGYFHLKAPIDGLVLTPDFEDHTHRLVKPNEPILRIGDTTRDWEIELKIPQMHIAQVMQAFATLNTEVLEVDLVLRSAPTKTFRGLLRKSKIGGEATPNKDEATETEPVVLAFVELDGGDFDEALRVGREIRKAGTEVVAKIRCGNRAMGYSLFYPVWEFIYEKIVFRF